MPDEIPGGQLENAELTRVIIIDALDGNTRTVPGMAQTVTVDAAGGRVFTDTKHHLRTKDGRIIQDAAVERIYQCRRCRLEPLAEAAVTLCPCGRVVCRTKCTRTNIAGQHVCVWCYRKELFWRFVKWVFQRH